jgi:bifunctional enzyme CysN/CysC/sulfate adenylyltransferase subunit 1
MIVGAELLPGVSVDLQARVCWMAQKPLLPNRKFFLKHSTQTVQAVVAGIESKLDIHTFDSQLDATELAMNDIGVIRLRTARPLVYDGYGTNRSTGAFILVEQGTNATVAAGMLKPPLAAFKPELDDFTI